MSEIKRFHIDFYGNVQGVGFRFTAQGLAQELGLTGWVRNQYDGSVEMEVQGTEKCVNFLISQLENEVFIEIDNIIKREVPAKDQEKRFVITW